MIYLNIVLTVKTTQDIPEIRSLLATQARLSRLEPGCLQFDIYQAQENPAVFILHEEWDSAESLAVHRTATAYTTVYKPQVLPKVNRTAYPCDKVPV